jgi:exopolyphosphatase/guanosine-5'-triphosphate,3'-diphosphate pyrophosphatase
MAERRPRNLAAIDIGTSSLHLAIARPQAGGRPELLLREKVPVRLGSGTGDMKSLDPAAVDRGVEVLVAFRALADAHDADIHAVATSAVREAENPSIFLDRARDEAGIEVDVISGMEEARLIHLGVLGAVDFTEHPYLVIDIGGGSTEFIVGHHTNLLLARSLKIGHVRLANRFFPAGVVDPDSIDACRRYIRSFIAPAAITIRQQRVRQVAGASGTFQTIAAVSGGAEAQDPRTPIDRAAVDAAVDRILSCPTAEERLSIPGVEPHRADTIAAGAILVQTLMDSLGLTSFVVSPDALREGLVLDRLDRRDPSPDTLLHLGSVRSSSVQAVAERFGENLSHARQATDIALTLFDATVDLHGLGDYERDILEGASMLHNVGRFIGHGAHHRHSYYLIRNSDHLAGFSVRELELMAQVARYHRKSEPKPTHAEYMALSATDQRIVATLAGMLRIGIALDRTYRNIATDLAVGVSDRAVDIVVDGDPDDLELELFAANERRGLLERALARTVTVTARRSEPVEMTDA